MTDQERQSKYFYPGNWVGQAISILRALERDAGDVEIATFGFEMLRSAGLCDDYTDWTILTNRLASDTQTTDEILLSSTTAQHFRRHERIRRAFNHAIEQGPPRLLNIGKLVRESGADREDVISVVKAMVNGREGPRYLHGAEWIGADQVMLHSMSLGEGAGVEGTRTIQYYPHAPLAGLYQPLETSFGSGAWGSVTRHSVTRSTIWASPGSEVALKIIPEALLMRMAGASNGALADARVLREFLIGRRHSSRRLVRTYDVIKVMLHGNNSIQTPHFCIIMEVIGGLPLGAQLVSTMDYNRRWRIAVALTRAVADFHELGVHRDIKPGNAILRESTDADVVLVDYGIAKGDSDDTITETDANFAALYAAPQQLETPGDEHRADDIYALGLSIAELILARKPFKGVPRVKIYAEKLRAPFSDQYLVSLSPAIAKLVWRMTSPDRRERPNVKEVLELLIVANPALLTE